MSQLRYLMEEICAGVEIYFTGRVGGQYLKTAYILCDDYTELTSKLYLLMDNSSWSDKKKNGYYKSYHDVQADVRTVVAAKLPAHTARIQELHNAMKASRERRNDFFHSTKLLDLSVTQPRCVEAFCDLFDYGEILFPYDWRRAIEAARNLETLEVLLRLEKKGANDPSILPVVAKVIADWPRNYSNAARKGVHLAIHPEDMHLRLCVTSGGKQLRDKLKTLL